MEEDTGVKAPVTRLRRRLSVEQSDDVKSPGPATPTKKRGGRLAAKPQLELIDEDGANSTPSKRTTRKASAKEIVEAAEEKTVTPSRRSTRIKSNTSIVSETTQSVDSPRAKRAARRTSQIGSDSESSATPIRQTRRTRKDSTSSVEKLEITLSGKPQITEVIIEEENVSVKSDDTTKGSENSASTRKSPRLREKRQENKDRKSMDKTNNEVEIPTEIVSEDQLNISKQNKIERKSLESSNKDDVTPEDMLNVSKQNRKKDRKSIEEPSIEVHVSNDDTAENQLNVSKQSQKKERKSVEQSSNEVENTNDGDTGTEQLNVSKQSRKKERKSVDQSSNEIQFTDDVDTPEDYLNVSKQNRKMERKSLEPSKKVDNFSNESSIENLNDSIQNQSKETSNDVNMVENSNDTDTLNISKESRKKSRKSTEKAHPDNEITSENYANSALNDSKHLTYKERKSVEGSTNENGVMNDSSTKKEITLKESNDNLSESRLMIQELDKKPKRKTSIINKSTSALDNPNSFQSKRQRTKSWTITTTSQENEGVFYSDNESAKKKLKKRTSKEFKRQSNHTGSDDFENNDLTTITNELSKSDNQNIYLSPSKSKIPEISETISPQGNKENILVSSTSENVDESSVKFFEKAPTAVLKSTVYFEESDTDSKERINTVMRLDTEDQCVPVIDNQFVEKPIPIKSNSILEEKNNDDSCEPMDIDETIPNNISLKDNVNKSSINEKSIPSLPFMDNTLNNSSNKSKRKSSLSNTQNLEKSGTENKSTLILSQLKDLSSTEHNVTKSPKTSTEQLSKSVSSLDVVKDKALNKKNLSQDYSTSTPLQQKKMKKLGMQINSSIINSSNIDKQIKSNNASKNEMSQISRSSETSSDDDDDDDEEEEDDSDAEDEENLSNDKSAFLDDEADEASDDYESGDSRDDEQRQYEDENEIVEKGETLDSDDDMSNDSDYEKDSFVVSSDEEDNDLLSGSGDDLSMSDNELSMSKKSKKKYDERKQKEQKKASKEMYKARHKLNNSDISKSKKHAKRLQISSESEESEEDVVVAVKKNKHLRLDSTNDDDLDKSNTNDSLIKSKSKTKRRSKSICNESVTQEQEISAINVTQTNDPLSGQIKLEPKTPLKDLNISTVHINENIEEVQVDNNVSIIKTIEATDPLQATMLAEEEDSSMSENSEIMNNYDSVLNELNSAADAKIVKSHDMSLNLNKKPKTAKEPIIDQLNLTKTKKQKKATGSDVVDSGVASNTPCKKINKTITVEEESSSDSIDLQDMRLLFSEDSNDCVDDKEQRNVTNQSLKGTDDVDDFIPLKRTPGKINILTNDDNNEQSGMNTTLNESTKKKNKKRKSQGPTEEITGDDNNDIQIIIDTQGTHETTVEPCNISLNSSSKKKNKRNSVTFQNNEDSNKEVSTYDEDAPEEVPYESTKKKNKNRKSSETIEVHLSGDEADKTINMSGDLSSAKKNKKKRVSENHSSQTEQATRTDANISLGNSKTRKSVNTSQIASEANIHESSLNVSVKSDKKKTKRLSEAQITENIISEETEKVDKNVSLGSAKKQKASKVTPEITLPLLDILSTAPEATTNNSKKRKRKSSGNEIIDSLVTEEDDSNKLNESSLNGSRKKKRKISQNEDIVGPTHDSDISKKKTKKRKERDDDIGNSVSKIFKENSFDKVTRLPASVLNELEDKPRKEVLESKKSSLVSTTPFIVEDTRKRRNKPSKFLEESVYLNDTQVEKKQKGNIKKPKVLPFIPTAVTSASGFTTSFKINIIPQEVQFVAQTKNVSNFKTEYLYGKKIKRLGTYETYKKHRNAKMSKF